MKKAISLFLALVLCLSLCACGAPKTFSDAVAKAEEKIEKWDSACYNTYHYTSTYPENGKSFTIIMIPTEFDSHPEMYTKFMAESCAKEIYEKTAKCFSSLDTAVLIAVGTQDGNILYLFNSENFK